MSTTAPKWPATATAGRTAPLPQERDQNKPRRLRIAGVPCVEMTGEKWLGSRQTAEFYTKGKRL